MNEAWVCLGTVITAPGVTGAAYVAPLRKENEMSTRIDHTDPAVVALREARAAEAAQRGSELLQQVRSWQLHAVTRGTIVRFTKDFDSTDPERAYHYAAIKIGPGKSARWFVSGDPSSFTNEQFEELLVTSGGFRDFEIVHAGLDAGEDE